MGPRYAFLPALAALGGMLLCACAHTAPMSKPSSAKEPMDMATSETAHEHNRLSAEEIGKRFLKLVEGLQSRQDLSLERVQAVTGLTLEASENGSFFGYSQKLDGGWSYAFTFIPEAPSIKKGMGLDFNRANDRSSDMTPVCTIDFEHYRNALKSFGFAESPVHGEIGQIDEWRYYRGDLTLSIIPQNAVPGEAGRLCVKSIGTLN